MIIKLQALSSHSYIADQQMKYFKTRKENIKDNEVLVLMDFAENYGFDLQDETQAYHWNHDGCTIHPVVLYFKIKGELCCISLCFVSDDLLHDVGMVWKVQQELVKFIKSRYAFIDQVEYFTDGCAAQYKNCKSFLNLCHHLEDFGIVAKWTFFATSHGKSACDGVGGTVKRMVTRYNLQRPLLDQITTAAELFDMCSRSASKIHYIFISAADMVFIRQSLKERFNIAKTVKGTRSFHHFFRSTDTMVSMKILSADDIFYTSKVIR